MNLAGILKRYLRDRRGMAAIEFAILAPMIIVLLLGVLAIGIQMQNFNSLRSIAYDVNRYTVIQYQKDIEFDADQIRDKALAIAGSSPYNLATGDEARFDVTVEEGATPITGARRFDLTLTYIPMKIAMPLDLDPPKLTKTQAIIVPD